MEKPRILVIDDEDIICELLKRTLGEKGYEVETVNDSAVALEKMKKAFYNVIITDLKMPHVSGIEVLRKIKEINPYIEVIIVTGYATIEAAVEAVKIGAFDFICKPFDIGFFEACIARCLSKQQSAMQAIELGELNTFFELSKIITARVNLDTILGLILDAGLNLVRAQQGYIAFYDEQSKGLGIRASRGLPQAAREAAGTPGSPDGHTCGDAGVSLKIPLVAAAAEPDRQQLGMIVISHRSPDRKFTEREKTLLSVLVGQASAVIENYRLYNRLQEKIEVMEKTVQELQGTQNQLIQTEKMAAVGQLAFGIAHEIRNPLGIVLGGVDFIGSLIPDKEQLFNESIGKMKQAIERANGIIVSLLKFSRASQLNFQPVNAAAVLDETITLLANQAILCKVKIDKLYDIPSPVVAADATMLRQAFFNICVNAFDAMPGGGRLTVRIRQTVVNPGNIPSVGIEIADTGGGIPPDVLLKIFDPFFTTKEPGKGTGLGLSITHLIIQRHHGTIRAESSPGEGTKFIITLPLAARLTQERRG